MLITFADNDRSQKTDSTGFNKIGYITQSQQVIFPWRNRLIKKPLSVIEKNPHKRYPVPEVLEKDNVEKFFVENFQTLDLFNLGMSSILRNDVAYFALPIKLPRLEPIDKQSRDDCWIALKSLASEGDLLFTFDTASLFSQIISLVDGGPWSHCALYTGERTVIEALTAGVCERLIDVYADSRYRVGLYRLRSGLVNQGDIVEFRQSVIGRPYSYRKAALVGMQKLLRLPRSLPTPNDLAINPELELLQLA